MSENLFLKEIVKIHPLPEKFSPSLPMKKFTYTKTDSNKVYFANYDMLQAEIRWVRNSGLYNPEKAATIGLYNDYFSGRIGSIVFQTIRESKALAYSTFAAYSSPGSREKQNTMIAYVVTQADKVGEAIDGMNELLNTYYLNQINLLIYRRTTPWMA